MASLKETVTVLFVDGDRQRTMEFSRLFGDLPGYDVRLIKVNSLQLALSRLLHGDIDLCVAGSPKGRQSALDLISELQQRKMNCPVIALVKAGSRDDGMAAIAAGAAEYLDRSGTDSETLARTVRHALAMSRCLRDCEARSEFFRSTLENAGAAIAALDADANLITSNSTFDVFHENLSAMEDSGACPLRRLAAQLEYRRGIPLELRGVGGSDYEIRRNVMPNGGSVIIAFDISGQKAKQDDLLAARQEAENASLAKSSFLAHVGHELRTPLNSIIGFSDVIIQQSPACDPVSFANEINRSGRHLLGLINSLLDFSKMEAGSYPCNDDILDLDEIIRFAVRQVVSVQGGCNVSITHSIDTNLYALIGDEIAMRRIIINCLSNAVRFSREDGNVSVRAEIADDGGLELTIADKGIGMDPDDVPQALLPFRQVHRALDRRYEGTGLGLAIVKSLTDLHNGKLRIETAKGEGTSIIVYFPPHRVWTHDAQRRINDQ